MMGAPRFAQILWEKWLGPSTQARRGLVTKGGFALAFAQDDGVFGRAGFFLADDGSEAAGTRAFPSAT